MTGCDKVISCYGSGFATDGTFLYTTSSEDEILQYTEDLVINCVF